MSKEQCDKRHAFEKWLMAAAPGRFHEESFDIAPHGDYYENAETHLFWTVWEAGRASTPSHVAEKHYPEQWTDKDGKRQLTCECGKPLPCALSTIAPKVTNQLLGNSEQLPSAPVTTRRIDEAHSYFTRTAASEPHHEPHEAFGMKHRPYAQGDEECYICTLLRENSSLRSAIACRWIPVSERTPEAKLGSEVMVWVCAKRKDGKRVVYPLWWVNRPYSEETQGQSWEVEGENGDPMDCVGWHQLGANSSYDEFFVPEQDPQEIVAWMPIEKPNYAADGGKQT